MYIDIGGNVWLEQNKIVAVFDLDSITEAAKNKSGQFLHYATENAKLIAVEPESLPQSLVLTMRIAYLSPFNSRKLVERLRLQRF